ncbi:MAG TPA: pantoate--beta-alanine ligase [Pyrinomonadaceae bacterium]|nr:pantoate--beta-alanine ligase [Pyrinomonadaceae bacterium]HMP66947.1 pantoate--beta-alanine ligase [Pyrinomonadaceae bacterium]
MDIISRKQRIASITRKLRRENKTIALVPTMGALHEGHLELIRRARSMADEVVVSIFVNPEQFDDSDDLDRYPRDLARDAAMLADYDVDHIFAPEASEMYPEGFSTYVYVEGLSDRLEGASRPGHFRGVATIVAILFGIIRPDIAVFGQKDAQQLAVIRRLTRDLGFETEIVSVPTAREASGLARSSRNELLSPEQREKASKIYQSLKLGLEAYQYGERNGPKIAEMVRQELENEPEAEIDYVEAVDPETLETIETIGDRPVLLAVAARFGAVRLIDNLILGEGQ